jgi:hypothetical protein
VSCYRYGDVGSGGLAESVYTKILSGDEDGDWWASAVPLGGGERTTAGQAEHTLDALFGFDADLPVNDAPGPDSGPTALVVHRGRAYKITRTLYLAPTHEWQMGGVFADDGSYTLVG